MEAGMDAPFDSGCGPLNVPANCGGCGTACTATASNGANTASCGGSGNPDGQGDICTYVCKTGRLDCNAMDAPNTDGCECTYTGTTAPACCSDTCPIQHNNGLNLGTSKFYDCVASGTYNATLAMDACKAFTGNASQCSSGQCLAADGGSDGDYVVCATGSSSNCVCWTYQGPDIGYFHDPGLPAGSGDMNCLCANTVLDSGNTWQ